MAGNKRSGSRFLAALLMGVSALPAYAQDETTLVRGTINFARDGGMIGLVMEVLTTKQQAVYIYLDNTFKVAQVEPIAIEDVAVGDRAAIPAHGDEASVVWHLAEGDLLDEMPWPLPDGTELTAGEVTARTDGTIAITTSDGDLTAGIGAETVVVATTAESSNMSLLREGAPVVVIAERAPDGTLSTGRIYIGSGEELPL